MTPQSPTSHILPMKPFFSEEVLTSMITFGINIYSTTENTYTQTLPSVNLLENEMMVMVS